MIPLVFRGCAFLVGRRCAEPEEILKVLRWLDRVSPYRGGWTSQAYFNSNEPQSNAIILVTPLTSTWRTFVPLLKKTMTLLLSRPAATDTLFASWRFATVTNFRPSIVCRKTPPSSKPGQKSTVGR